MPTKKNNLNSDYVGIEDGTTSPLALYSEYQRMEIELRTPETMLIPHWHGQVEVNIPFDGNVEYLINGEKISVEQGHITIFWACVPHRLISVNNCTSMAIFNLPMHLFLSWPLKKELINHITHGMVVRSSFPHQVSPFEVARWQDELTQSNEQIKQITIEEISLMIKRFGFMGWNSLLVNKAAKTSNNGVSKHSQFYVSQMLEFIAENYDTSLSVNQVAEHVKLNSNYAMGIFQSVMQLTMKQYITAMRINHARVLLSDSDKTVFDIALTAGFNSSSRFYDTFRKVVGMTPQKYRKMTKSQIPSE